MRIYISDPLACTRFDDANGILDVLIIDAGADLNVYMDSLPGREERTGENGDKSGGSCAPKATESTLCCPAPAPKATEATLCCPAPASKKDGSAALGLATMAADLADINLNEWIGKLENRFLAYDNSANVLA